MKVFIVLHHEIVGTPDCLDADEMFFGAASSMKQALRLIRTTHVDRWSWWEIQVTNLDSPDWPVHVGWYGRRGGKLARPSFEKCQKIFLQERWPNKAK